MDLSVNSMYKGTLKARFTDWYAQKVTDAMNLHKENIQAVVNPVQPDLKLSVVKPLHAGWTIWTRTILLRSGKALFSLDGKNLACCRQSREAKLVAMNMMSPPSNHAARKWIVTEKQ